MASKLLEKDKKDVAALLKAECCGYHSNHLILNEFLDHLLGTKALLNQQEILDWCKTIIAGDRTYEFFCDHVRSFNNSSVCGLVWNADYVAYRCRTCAKTPCMSLCSECFLAADHLGHDFNMFKSQAGGACDCGDESVMDSQGFCSKHCRRSGNDISLPPSDLLVVAEAVVPRLLVKLIYILGRQASDKNDIVILEEASGLINFLQELSDMGTIMQNVICNNISDELLYSRNFKNPSSEYFHEQKYHLAQELLACNYNASADFPEISHLDKPLIHTSIIDELFFWIIKFQFSQNLVTFVLSLLPNEKYKLNFVKVFMKHYMCSMNSICLVTEKSTISNAIVHISVQLLSAMHLAIETVEKHHLLQIMLVCLKNIIKPSLMKIGSGRALVVNCSQRSNLKEHCYWPIVTDIVNVLSHEPVIKYFLSNFSLVTSWAKIVSYFQGMNINKKEKHHHLEFEPEGYYQAFSAELEICSTPLWTMLMHLNKPDLKHLTLNVIDIFQVTLAEWLDATEEVKADVMSFHYPLHRYLSLFISNAIQNQGLNSEDLISSDEFLKKLLSHPLHLLACYSEINCNMWIRNGQQIKGQAMFYTHWNFASSTMDPDYFLIQVIASRLDPDEVLKMILTEYHVIEALSFIVSSEEKSSHPQHEHELPMLESCLFFLATLLNIRVLSGDINELIPNELINLLCVADRTHSQLMSSIPDRCESHNPKWLNAIEAALPMVSIFKPPVFEIGAIPQQGKYIPQAHVWVEKYNPLFVKMRTLYKKDFQASYDRFCDFIKQQNLYKGSSTLWPPFRLPEPLHLSLGGLYRILHCSTMHALIFTLLYKALTVKSFPESIIYLTIHLLELVITLPHDAPAKKADHCVEFKDQIFSSWYSGNDIFENVLLVIPCITVNRTKEHNDEDNCLSKFNFLMKEGETSKAAGHATLSINESIITMLIKLYAKFSKEPYFFQGRSMDEKESRIGDGQFFIRKVLDKLTAESDACAREVIKLCEIKESSAGTSDNMQDRRLKAKLRQQRLLSDFASKQKKFIEEVITQVDTSKTESLEAEAIEFPGKIYDCCICNVSAPSTSIQPIGISARICQTSILGRQRVSNSKSCPLYLAQIERFNELLGRDSQKTEETLWFKAPHLQTCGHYMHLDCFTSYFNSLQNQNQMTVLVTKGEFFCPMCRQISNTILPLIEDNFPLTQFIPNCEHSESKQIEELLEVNLHEMHESKELNQAINLAIDDFQKNSSYRHNDDFNFSALMLRNNLELNLLKIHSKKKFCISSVIRKSCVYPLYAVLSNSSKRFCPDYLAILWSYMTTFTDRSRSYNEFDDVPILLKDISDIFVQFLLALPFNLEEKHFFTLVRVLYNIKLIQLLVHVVCSLTPCEMSYWKEKNSNELGNVIMFIIDIFYVLSSNTTEDACPLRTSDLETFVMEGLLPYLRISSIAHHYLYNSFNEVSSLPLCHHGSTIVEFKELSSYLHLKVVNNVPGFIGLAADEVKLLVEKTCNDFKCFSPSATQRKELVSFLTVKWDTPSLIQLPEVFDTLFQFYRKEVCKDCHKVPKYPSLCLICGKLICYNDNCCSKKELPEYIWHSEECGNKTGLYLGIDSSLVLIMQSQRMAFWGSLYLDKYGEEDKNLRRGKPLYLNKERYNLLNHMWLTHSLDQLCKQWTIQGN